MLNTRIHQITKELNKTSEVSAEFFKSEFNKFVKRIEDLSSELEKELATINRKIIEAEEGLKNARKEQTKVEEQTKASQGKLDELDKRDKEVSEREKNVADLHKILENKRLLLDAKEKDLQTKTRRSGV